MRPLSRSFGWSVLLRSLFLITFIFCWIGSPAWALQKENLFSRDFELIHGAVPGIDFLVTERSEVAELKEPVQRVRERLQLLLGPNLPEGAVFICSSSEQRDAVYEPRALRMGYRWVVMTLNPEAGARETIERMKARFGGDIPADRLERIRSRASSMQGRMVERTLLEISFAILTTTEEGRSFRYSRVEDMNRSSLSDWLDIGVSFYAANAVESQLFYLQRRTGEMFSIEDILTMSRPFVVPATALGEASSGGPRMAPGGGSAGPPDGGVPGPPRTGPPDSSSIPKDVRDRSMFDAEAAALFAYLVDKVGLDKAKELVERNRAGEECDAVVHEAGFLGPDIEAIEKDWLSWIAARGGPGEGFRGRPQQGQPPQ